MFSLDTHTLREATWVGPERTCCQHTLVRGGVGTLDTLVRGGVGTLDKHTLRQSTWVGAP